MATLIADCNAETESADGYITMAGSLNIPTTITPQGEVDNVFASGTFISKLATGSLIVQEIEGIDDVKQSTTTKYTRFSSTEAGHVLGTDFSEWLKSS